MKVMTTEEAQNWCSKVGPKLFVARWAMSASANFN
jgi:hypothetical protein